ncbi:MAG: hypothetical protein IPL58_02580 [Betaproteobacteria bacterium]|uniref:DUF5666 domain-containing protein n=1 Tax=Candidatus Proximibacter danicus TaxID=2954365 RepID=A0A9D7PPB2_9PROT|nr:hypothetical protein [Candidatus Proximibacter danicus]
MFQQKEIKSMRRFASALCMATTVTFSGMAVATDSAEVNSPPAKPRKPLLAKSEMIRSVAEVVSIDMSHRSITLKRDDGNTLTVVAGPAVKNLAQIQVGDFVVAQYGRALAVSLKKGTGVRSATETENGNTAKPGEKPSASGKRTLVIVADIIAIDDKKGLATLKGPKGNVVDVMVKDLKSLAAVQVGDQVELAYTEALAISVKPAKTKK